MSWQSPAVYGECLFSDGTLSQHPALVISPYPRRGSEERNSWLHAFSTLNTIQHQRAICHGASRYQDKGKQLNCTQDNPFFQRREKQSRPEKSFIKLCVHSPCRFFFEITFLNLVLTADDNCRTFSSCICAVASLVWLSNL